MSVGKRDQNFEWQVRKPINLLTFADRSGTLTLPEEPREKQKHDETHQKQNKQIQSQSKMSATQTTNTFNNESDDFVFKFIIVGDSGVG